MEPELRGITVQARALTLRPWNPKGMGMGCSVHRAVQGLLLKLRRQVGIVGEAKEPLPHSDFSSSSSVC